MSNEHFEYILAKQEQSVKMWNKVMQLNGLFKDLAEIKRLTNKIGTGQN